VGDHVNFQHLPSPRTWCFNWRHKVVNLHLVYPKPLCNRVKEEWAKVREKWEMEDSICKTCYPIQGEGWKGRETVW